MADRLNQYPMLPPTFNQSMLQQQHSQQAQSQGDLHSTVQGIPNTEHSRMWQSMQQQMQRDPYRAQGGGDMANPQVNQQMADLLRSQNLARVQGQQQMGQRQQFGMTSSQMNNPGQHPGFHDHQTSQQNQPQTSAGFGSNMGIPNSTQLQGNFSNRNAMLQAFNQGPMSRQLELMNLAQSQQHQNPQAGPANFAARMAQQHQQSGMSGQNQQGQASLFSSPSTQASDANRTSPSHPPSQTLSIPNLHGGMQANEQGLSPGQRNMTYLELRDRITQLRSLIAKQEAAAMSLSSNRASVEQGTFLNQMQALAAEVRSKKDVLARLMQAMNQASQGSNSGSGPQGANPGNMQGMGASPGPQHQQGVLGGQNQPGWMAQPGSGQVLPQQQQVFPIGRGGPPLPARGPSQPQSLQPSPQLHSTSQMHQNNLGPQRPGSTPHQHMTGQLPNQISPSMSNQFPSGQLPTQNGQNLSSFLLPPLDESKFKELYNAFRNTRPTMRDERTIQVDNRPIDLYKLHYNVLSEGGIAQVMARDMWAIIGARMGYAQFPGSDTEPAKSGLGVAQQLLHIYTEYLAQFDKIYIHSVLQKKALFTSQPGTNATGGPPANNSAANNSAAISPQVNNNPAPVQSNTGPPGNNMPGANQVSMMNAVLVYANVSAVDLRARGIPEQVVQFVEHNRAHLQRTSQQQQMFRGVMQKPNITGQTSEPGRMNTDILGSFSGMQPSQQPGSIPTGARQQQPSHPPGMNANGSGNGQSQLPQKPLPINSMATMQASRPPRPTPEQSQEAFQFVQRSKSDFIMKNLPNMKQHQVPEAQRAEYNRILEQAYRLAQEIEPKLPMYFYVLKDADMIRKLIAIIYTTREQRNFISNSTQKYILPLSTLSTLIAQVQQVNAQFSAAVATYMPQTAGVRPANGHPGQNGQPQRVPIPSQGPSHPPSQQQPQQQQQTPPQPIQTTPSLPAQNIPPPSSNRPVHLNPPPTSRKKPHQATLNAVAAAAASTPTPPASTPAASAATPATPAATSPKTPKSPKAKAPAKPKASSTQSKRKSSRIVQATPEAIQINAPSPSGSLKRQREEEPIVGTPPVSNAPSPKKAKTELEGERGEALVKKEQQIENIKTDEDASAFLEQMTELIRLAAGNDGQESLTSDISETLDMILKGCGQDTSDPGTMASLGLGDVAGRASSPSSLLPAADEFQFKDFLDFTSCAADEDYSKPATPDLIASSSTNPSPESMSDPADVAGHAATGPSSDDAKLVNFKIEDSYDSDLLRLGVWKEIDGGESAYYQPDKWIWEGTMPVLDQPWAFAS